MIKPQPGDFIRLVDHHGEEFVIVCRAADDTAARNGWQLAHPQTWSR